MADPGIRLPDLRTQVMSFKVAQLQDCAGRIGISKSGKKADVQSRLLAFFGIDPTFGGGDVAAGTEGKLQNAARVVRDVYLVYMGYRRPSPAASPASGASPAPGVAGASAAAAGSAAVRCLCQRGADPRMTMVQCTEPGCGIWQHERCVAGAVTAAGGAARYRCEQCRVVLADPFWQPLDLLLPVAALKTATGVPPIRDPHSGELHPHQHAERAVFLAEPHVTQAKNSPTQHRIQVGCLLLEDSVQCRHHWPRNVALKVNNIAYRPYGRSATAKMGINQRDEPASVASLCFGGRNTVDLQAVEAGTWLLLLQRSRRRSLDEVKSMMAPTESLSEAVSRVKRLLHGGADLGDEDAIAVASQVVSLKDPMSGQRMAAPGRFAGASGLQAFDLDSFLSLAARNRKWQDPTTLKNSTVRAMQVDAYTAAVLAAAAERPEITEIEINDEGKWRPEGAGESCDWLSVEDSVEEVKAALKAWAAAGRGGGGGGGGAAGNGKAGGSIGEDGVVLDDSESDEEEEVRQAAAAVKAAAVAAAAASGQKRKQPEPEPEVIDLCSDSDGEPGPVAAAPAPAAVRQRLDDSTRPAAPAAQTVNEIRAETLHHPLQTAANGGASEAQPRGPPLPPGTLVPASEKTARIPLRKPLAAPTQPQPPPIPSGNKPTASQPTQAARPTPSGSAPPAAPTYSTAPQHIQVNFQALISQAQFLQSMRGQVGGGGGAGAGAAAPPPAAHVRPAQQTISLRLSNGSQSPQIYVSSGNTRIVVPPHLMPGAAAARPPAEAMLSETARAALEAERARLASDPSLMDEVDEWLN